ncbi:hypothetical protein Tco_0592839 [Tanacetum coccineum]
MRRRDGNIKLIEAPEFLEFQMNLLVVERRRLNEVETQVEFLRECLFLSSLSVLSQHQVRSGQCDHGLLTSLELRTAFCNLHSLVGIGFPHAVMMNLLHIGFYQVSEAIPERSLNSPVNSISDGFIQQLCHRMEAEVKAEFARMLDTQQRMFNKRVADLDARLDKMVKETDEEFALMLRDARKTKKFIIGNGFHYFLNKFRESEMLGTRLGACISANILDGMRQCLEAGFVHGK